jgi:hypothetical protein
LAAGRYDAAGHVSIRWLEVSMKRQLLALGVVAVLALAFPFTLRAADASAADEKIDQKTNKLIDGLELTDAGKADNAKTITREWLGTMLAWHKQHDAELNGLWSDWNEARAVKPKDEFPGEVIAHKIDDAYASLKPAYDEFLKGLAAELTPEQIDALKEAWSRKPGMMRTYKAYLEIAPDLSEQDKQVIHDRMLMAREAAMLTDSDKEIVSIYKRHKVKVEQYIGGLQWTKLHQAYAEKSKRDAGEKKEKPSGNESAKASAAPAK